MYSPMLARVGTQRDLDLEDWIFEPKLDGTRAICYVDGDLRFINRRNNDITSRYPELDLRASIGVSSCVLDGEVVVYDGNGNPSFHLLQKREKVSPSRVGLLSSQHPATFVVFDVLEIEGRKLLLEPLDERKRLLEDTVDVTDRIQIMFYTTKGRELWKMIEERDIEGVMAKSVHSVYESGRRSSHWLKIKTVRTVDCIVVGYSHENRAISSLALALHSNEGLRYMGSVGAGLTERLMENLLPVLQELEGEVEILDPPKRKDITWISPRIVCEVEYLELTRNGHLRAPSFKRIRLDKPPEECTIDSVS